MCEVSWATGIHGDRIFPAGSRIIPSFTASADDVYDNKVSRRAGTRGEMNGGVGAQMERVCRMVCGQGADGVGWRFLRRGRSKGTKR